MPFGREILLRNVKCLWAWVDLFHFTFCIGRKFHNSLSELFHICRKANISLKQGYCGLVVLSILCIENPLHW